MLYVCSICFLFLLPLHIVIIVVVSAYSMQESIRNSADGMLLSPDSLVVYIAKNQGFDGDQQPSSATVASPPRKNRVHSFGIDGLDLLKFTYKVYYVWVHFLYLSTPFHESTLMCTCIGCNRSPGHLNLLLMQRLLRSITK